MTDKPQKETWYVPINKTVKIGEQHTVETAYGRFQRKYEGKVFHHLVVVNNADNPVGIVTFEAVREYIDKNPINTGELPRRPHLVTSCMVKREEILEFSADRPQQEVRAAILSNWDQFRNVRAIFLLGKDKTIVGFAVDYDIFKDVPP